MPLLNVQELSRSYGPEIILDGVTFQLQPGDKAGLIGPNGSGKTTLLKIIAAELEPDGGRFQLTNGARIGYLPQEPPVLEEGTLSDHLRYPLRHLYALQDEIAALEKEIASRSGLNRTPPADQLERYAALAERFAAEGGYQVESRLIAVARGLGFAPDDLGRDLSTFSGGEKTRARLAGLLLRDPDLLLLDEPTNFLDLSALEWLEKHLRDLSCAQLVVSHDRFFLDRVAGRILALQGGKIKAYKGNYSAYRRRLDHDRLSSERERRRLELIRAREERLVREAKIDRRSKRQASSRQKRLDKLETVERVADERGFKPGLGCSGRSGRQTVVFDQVGIAFDGTFLFRDISFTIHWGDRLALTGPNGAGKSTLLKLITGTIEPSSGSVRLGPSVRVLYFSQEQEQLDDRQTLLEVITSASAFDLQEARNHLGRYLFRGDDVFKKVSSLSGGEKSRLALARLALGRGNCLLMDEPTSHLDLPALEELEKALAAYPGTLVVVSHDRYFLKNLANRVFELQGGAMRVFDQPFSEYLELQQGTKSPPPVDGEKREEKNRRREEHRRRRAASNRLRRLEEEQKGIEEEIGAVEAEITRLEEILSDPARYGDPDRLAELGLSLQEQKNALDVLLQSWEDLASKLD